MLIGYADEEGDNPTSTHISTDDLNPSSENIYRLIKVFNQNELTVKEMMEKIGLKNRPNFLEYSLTPAIREGFVKMKYPESPRHPRQKYLLTIKGNMLLGNK